jgi:hypothetical protein
LIRTMARAGEAQCSARVTLGSTINAGTISL